MTQALRIGFVGAGGIAGRHLGNLLAFEDRPSVVVAATDPQPDRAEAFAARAGGGARAYADWRAMLDRERDLDALYICTPPFAHGPPELAAVERGLPFFVEKPIAADLATAETVADAVARAGLVTAVGYHWRYLDTVEEVQALLRENPPRLVLGHWLDTTPPPAWWSREAESGGQMVEQTTHIFDLARLFGGEVEEVHALASRTPRPAFPEADVADVSTASLRFASGAVGQVASTCLLGWRHRVEMHVFCEDLAIELSEFELAVHGGQGRPLRQAQGDPFLREDRDFLDAVKGRPDRIRAPYAEALRTHRLATAAARSAREGRPIRLAEAARG